ncbi:hypothetical protein AAFF_G00003320 [Aldrovandia affinis]|uniref:Uncharacterized protein n=1 Tax=Aldrovandia affinis TaxID=143900 RepID=A0AAD7TEY4_9TELE|nr:hypothetical protein AAFF_G00003320 [Aldrovandia affinis]
MVLLKVGSKVGYHNARQGFWKQLSQPEESWAALQKAVWSIERHRLPLDVLMHIATAGALLAGTPSGLGTCRGFVPACGTPHPAECRGVGDPRSWSQTESQPPVSLGVCGGMTHNMQSGHWPSPGSSWRQPKRLRPPGTPSPHMEIDASMCGHPHAGEQHPQGQR